MQRRFAGKSPVVDPTAFVADNASLIGDVRIGARSSIWFGAVLRGDVMPIVVGDDTSIQDNAVVHVTATIAGATIGNRVTVGHSCIVHACTIGDDCIIGMGSIILDLAVIGRGCIIGAGAVVTPRTVIPEYSLVVGNPAKVKRPVSDAERQWTTFSYRHYVELADKYRESE